VERDAQSCQRFARLGQRQGFRRSPETWNADLRIRIWREVQSENVVRFAVGQNSGGVVVDPDQVPCESVRAIDVVDEMGEFVVGNGALIIFEYIPFRFRPEDTEVIGGG